MDLVRLTQETKQASLVSLPKTDAIPNYSSEGSEREKKNELLLLHIPAGLTAADLASGCCFVAPPRSSEKGGAGQACLVLESKKKSFAVSRLETSNVLVMVPPLTCTNAAPPEEEPAHKKQKVTTTLLPVKARLLTPGGSGASFLELKQEVLRPGDVKILLEKHVFDPYRHHNNRHQQKNTTLGRTISSLANQLQCSGGQVHDALKILRAFPIPDPDAQQTETRYGILVEEALLETQNAIVSTLAEVDECADYANQGVIVDNLLTEAIKRLPLEKTFAHPEHVLRCAMTAFLKTQPDNNPIPLLVDIQTDSVRFDVTKIAVWLAHRLFQSQTQPWEERRFCLRWQSELPGVGNDYQTNLDMLRGVAIPAEGSPTKKKHYHGDDEEDEQKKFWKYFPAAKLSLNPEERFQALFDVREEWFSEDLEPYILGLVEDSGLSVTELLMNHTTSTIGSKNGKMGKLYRLHKQV